MRCDRFEYSSEELNTDVTAIDAIEDQYSLSTTNLEKLALEDGDLLLLQDGTHLVNEGSTVLAHEAVADNEVIGKEIIDNDIIDFTEFNPFADVRVY